ncbi:MAG: acetolactate decarboxylase [Candidatus Dadabacteria bacterium]|nr:acetolactate decarboxylase [Candidatus Dadabacteria bacterium]
MKLINAFILAVLCSLPAASLHARDKAETVFQTSTLSALMEGVYEGNTTFAELKSQGDFGLGTLNGLDGEMVGFGGVFYQVTSDGKAHEVPDDAVTPFAVVTFFEADKTVSIDGPLECEDLEKYILELLPSDNIFYAIKIDGRFESIKTRSVPRQLEPFPPLAEVVKKESVFELENAEGTIAGYWFPEYLSGVNAAGFHFHFLTADRKTGGHVLDCRAGKIKIEIDYNDDLQISLPKTENFLDADIPGAPKQQ